MSTSGDVRAGRAFVEIALEGLERFKGGMKQASDKIRIFGFAAQGAGRAMTSLGVSIAGPLMYAIKVASDFRESMNQFDIVFGSSATAAKKWGHATADAMNRAHSNTLEYMTNIRRLLDSEFTDGGATAITERLTQATLDWASVANETDEDAIKAVGKALTNSPEMLKDKGINVQDQEMKKYAKTLGMTWSQQSLMNKQLLRTKLILEKFEHAEGDVIKTQHELAGTLKELQGDAKDAAVEVGDSLIPVALRLLNAMKPIAEWFGNLARTSPKLIVLVAKFAFGFVTVGLALQAVGMAAQALSFALFVLSGALGILKLGIGGLMILNSILTGEFFTLTVVTNIWGFTTMWWGTLIAALTSPLGILIGVIAALGYAMLKWGGSISGIGKDALNYFKGLGTLLGDVFDAIKAHVISGDMEGAMKVMWMGLELVWLKGTEVLRSGWAGLMQEMKGSWAGTSSWLAKGMAKMARAWNPYFWVNQAWVDAIQEDADLIKDGNKKDATKATVEHTNRIHELEQKIKEATDAAKAAAEKKKQEGPETPGDLPGFGKNAGKGGGGVTGTFNSAIAAMMGAQPNEELVELKKIVDETKALKRIAEAEAAWRRRFIRKTREPFGPIWGL